MVSREAKICRGVEAPSSGCRSCSDLFVPHSFFVLTGSSLPGDGVSGYHQHPGYPLWEVCQDAQGRWPQSSLGCQIHGARSGVPVEMRSLISGTKGIVPGLGSKDPARAKEGCGCSWALLGTMSRDSESVGRGAGPCSQSTLDCPGGIAYTIAPY